jgi:hypothetical protein
MEREQIKAIIDSSDQYEDPKEDSLLTMVRVFYSKKMRAIAVVVWFWALLFTGGAIYCAVRFLASTETKAGIMYAALFICFFHGIGLMKIFAWSMIQRHSIRREIKRLELCVAELNESLRAV